MIAIVMALPSLLSVMTPFLVSDAMAYQASIATRSDPRFMIRHQVR